MTDIRHKPCTCPSCRVPGEVRRCECGGVWPCQCDRFRQTVLARLRRMLGGVR